MKSTPALTACISTRSRLGNILFALLGLAVIAAIAAPLPCFGAAAPPDQQAAPATIQELQAGQNLVESGTNDCRTCHSATEKIIGPSYDAIAKRYHGQPGAIDKLADKIKRGGAGNWGAVPMTPHPDLTDPELKEMVEWVLSLYPPVAPPGSPAGAQSAAGAAQPGSAAAPPAMQGSASRGEDLFTGRTAFRNRGPACIACHSVAGLDFPNGGTMAPNLTQTYTKLGPEGTAAAMETLYFPTMIPIYRDHQLIPQEQADLVAFFKRAAGAKPEWKWTTQILILAAFVLGIIFVAITAFVWRKRLRSVRRELVAGATRRGARS